MWQEPIPEELYNEDSKKPHQHCKICAKDLQAGEPYAIQKVFKNYPDQEQAQALFDFAMCQTCLQEARAELSKESRQNVDAFMLKGLQELNENEESPKDRYQSHRCTLSGKNLKEVGEYQLMAVCQGDQILESPICLSDDILEEIQGLLSQESKDELNRFTENNFGWPPELKKALIDGDIVLL
ncbi:MAG: hypothetical protein NXI09_14740 [Bacteroidetes bacterium]|nr:hypothetical protein [Bacteroidota bacterium]